MSCRRSSHTWTTSRTAFLVASSWLRDELDAPVAVTVISCRRCRAVPRRAEPNTRHNYINKGPRFTPTSTSSRPSGSSNVGSYERREDGHSLIQTGYSKLAEKEEVRGQDVEERLFGNEKGFMCMAELLRSNMLRSWICFSMNHDGKPES